MYTVVLVVMIAEIAIMGVLTWLLLSRWERNLRSGRSPAQSPPAAGAGAEAETKLEPTERESIVQRVAEKIMEERPRMTKPVARRAAEEIMRAAGGMGFIPPEKREE